MSSRTDFRTIFALLVPILLSFFTLYIFNVGIIITQIQQSSGTNVIRIISLMLSANFRFDAISMFTGEATPLGFLAPQFLIWLLLGYLSGTIAKGIKRGATTSFILVVIDILLWILFSVLASIDLMSLFTVDEIVFTLGGIFIALIAGVFGGLIGGWISGPYEGVL
ncbi:MAG: hypothetical protein ACFFAS_11035 [Promethearchaeota archaeon]